MARKTVENRKESIYEHWLKSRNMAKTGRIFGCTREYVRQVIKELSAKVKSTNAH